MKQQELKVPRKALQFVEHGSTLVELSQAEEGSRTRSASITGYSGGPIDHWYWGRLAINVEGIKFKKNTFPVLEDHLQSRKVGFSKKPDVSEGKLRLQATLLSTEAAQEFVSLNDQGFPYEASISVLPLTIRRFDKPTDVNVNGKLLKNMDVIIEASLYKETSICVFGYDSDTESSLDNADQGELITFKADCEGFEHTTQRQTVKEVKSMERIEMTLEQFKTTYPELAAAMVAEVKEGVKKDNLELTQQIEELSGAVKDLGTQVVALTDENKNLQQQNQEVSLKQAAADRKAQVAEIWETELSASKVPAKIQDKVKLMVSDAAFVKDGQLDVAAFTQAVKTEIADWESRDIAAGEVLGFASAGHTAPAAPATQEVKLVNDTVAKLKSFLPSDTLKKSA